MKNLITILFIALLLSGCASKEAHQQYIDGFKAASAGYYEAANKPLIDLTLPAPDGKEYHLVVNREIKPLTPEQIKDSEWVAPVQGLISATGMVAGAAVIIGGAGHNTETVGGDKSGTSMENPITTTTTTTTEMMMPEEVVAE